MADDRLGKYELRGTLGRGAMGTVYDGWDPAIARRVAIKTVRLPDATDAEAQDELARFKREAQAAGRLSHPNIVGVFDYGETDQIAYIVMEFVDGDSLKSLLDKQERFAVPETVRVMEELLAGLQFSHERGVVHRDIKPANVMMTRDGRVKIADFGIARIESSSMTQAGTVLGTPAYMSPEQFMGQTVDARTDIYSSGVLLYQLLTGERPFEGSMSAIMHKALNTEPPRPSDLSVTAPPAFDAVVRRAMARRPEERFATAADFAQALRQALVAPAMPGGLAALEPADAEATIISTTRGAPARPAATPAAPPVAEAEPRSRTPLIAGMAVVVLLVLGGGGWYLFGRNPPAPTAVTGPATTGQKTAKAKPAGTGAAAKPATTAGSTSQTASNQPGPAPAATAQTAPIQTAPAQPPSATPPVTAIPAPANVAPPTATAAAPPAAVPPPPAPLPAPALPAQAVPAPPQKLALIQPPADLRQAISSAIAPVSCTLLHGSLSGPQQVALTGLAGSGTPLSALHRALGSAAPSAAIDWQIHDFTGPYCAALDVLRPLAAPFSASTLTLRLAGGATALHNNQMIRPRVVMPGFAGWLQVDYLSHDGSVAHLYPAANDPARLLAAGSVVKLGDPGSANQWAVGPPFGQDMIIAVASSRPLFPAGKIATDPTAKTYLAALQAAIAAVQVQKGKVVGNALVLDTLH